MKIDVIDYKRKMFNLALTECFSILYEKVIGDRVHNMNEAVKLQSLSDHAKEIFISEMGLAKSTIGQTKNRINESGAHFTKILVAVAESVAEDKTNAVKENKGALDSLPTDLNDVDKEVIEKVFEERLDEENIDQVRDSITKAMLFEKRKAEDINNAINLDKHNSKDGSLSESVVSLIKRPPNTLLEAIYKKSMSDAIVEAVEKGFDTSKVITDNKEIIQEGSLAIYAIYETINMYGFKKFTPKETDALIGVYRK